MENLNLKVGITFYFTEEYLPTKRHKIPRKRRMVSCVDVSFRKITNLKEFPVALIVHDYQSIYEGDTWEEFQANREANKGDFRIVSEEIRTCDGKLYKARRFSYGAAVSNGFCPIDDAINGLRDVAVSDNYYDNRYAFRAWETKPDKPYIEGTSVKVSDNRKEVETYLQEKANQYIFADGKIWEECTEPMYVVCTFGLGHNHGGTGMFIEGFYNPNISAKNYFNALQREEAIAYADAVAARRGDTNDVGTFGVKNIEVLIPEVIKANPSKDHPNGGDEFMESLEGIINTSATVSEAGLGVLAMTMAQVAMG